MRNYHLDMTISHMRRLFGAVAFTGILTTGLLHAAPAHADEIDFLTDIKGAGFYSDIGNAPLVQAGREVCGMLETGKSPEQVARIVFERSGASSLGSAENFVAIAQQDLCI